MKSHNQHAICFIRWFTHSEREREFEVEKNRNVVDSRRAKINGAFSKNSRCSKSELKGNMNSNWHERKHTHTSPKRAESHMHTHTYLLILKTHTTRFLHASRIAMVPIHWKKKCHTLLCIYPNFVCDLWVFVCIGEKRIHCLSASLFDRIMKMVDSWWCRICVKCWQFIKFAFSSHKRCCFFFLRSFVCSFIQSQPSPLYSVRALSSIFSLSTLRIYMYIEFFFSSFLLVVHHTYHIALPLALGYVSVCFKRKFVHNALRLLCVVNRRKFL